MIERPSSQPRIPEEGEGASSDMEDLPVGNIIPGTRYRVLERIGRGGNGTVYAAEHIDLEKKVALKVLSGSLARAPEAAEQFRKEARAASKIGSPNICDVTDFGQTPDGRVFFVMEYLGRESLAGLVEAGRLPTERAIPILRQIAKALGAAHEKGIIHLDVKPDNVMLVARGGRPDGVKVVDFGLAKLLHDEPSADRIAGTPEYMAPERIIGEAYDHRADVYALGALAYQMLAGTVPLQGPSPIKTLELQLKARPEPLLARLPTAEVPSDLEALVMQMLDKDPAGRPASMAVVEGMLCEAQIAAGLTTAWDDLELPAVDEAWRARLTERMPSPRGRPKKAVVVAALGAAAVALSVAVYFGVFRKPKEVVKLVPVEVTRTEEAETVARWLASADRAAQAGRYVQPSGDSALDYIVLAEEEARKLERRSPGAETLRKAYASALAVVGNELSQADLRDLAVLKFKEALAFRPDDPELQRKADLSAEEKRSYAEAAPARAAARRPARPVHKEADQAKTVAADVFMAATRGRLSEARLRAKALAKVDADGSTTAGLSDGLRKKAQAAWDAGNKAEARPLYQLVAELDPNDHEASRRSEPEPEPPPARPAVAAAPAPPQPAAAPANRKHASSADPEAPRDEAGARAAVRAGQEALARTRLAEAESAFQHAIQLNPLDAEAIGGLAEVAFERARYAEALDYARRAVKLSPRSSKYLILVGDAYFKLVRYAEAQAAYEKARALAPRNEVVESRLLSLRGKLRTDR